MSLLVFSAVVPCLRNAGVTGSSPVGGTSTSTSLTAVYLSRGRKPWCVSLLDYLGGNTTKSNNLAALIGANNGPAGATADATTQAAVWEAIYDDAPYNTGGGNFSLSDVHNDASLIADANALLTQAVSNSGATQSNLRLFVARNSEKQDMLFWTTSAVPEPSTWAMMLIGFGAIGIACRRSRKSPTLAPQTN